MAKIKFDKKMLKDFIAEKEELSKQIADYEVKKEGIYNTVLELENTINSLRIANSDMKSGKAKMDVSAYLENENKGIELQQQLEVAKREYATAVRVGDRLREDVYTPLIATHRDVLKEYDSNALLIQKEIFNHLKEVEKLCDTLIELANEYEKPYKSVPHPKAQYCGFNYMPKLSNIWDRFGIANRGAIRYAKWLTSTLYDFEQ